TPGREQAGSSSRSRSRADDRRPAWSRENSQGSAAGENDIAAKAAQVGSSLFKTANSLWTKGRKEVAKAITELQDSRSESSDGRPKWMRDAERAQSQERRRPVE